MNNIKTNTTGIDTPIKRIQTYLYDSLVSKWEVTKLDAYGRVYKNNRKDIVIPEYYLGDGEYKDVLKDDTKDGIFFFNVGDLHEVNGDVLSTNCEVIFSLNIKTIMNNTNRNDAEVQKDAFKLLNNFRGTFTINQLETGLDNVYSNFRGVARKFFDMQEFHHFKISGKINYSNNC